MRLEGGGIDSRTCRRGGAGKPTPAVSLRRWRRLRSPFPGPFPAPPASERSKRSIDVGDGLLCLLYTA